MPVLRLPPLPTAGGKQHWGNLPGAALSLAIAEAASQAKRFTLLLTADSQAADRLKEELAFFAPTLPVLHFPDWETLPYDLFSPHQDIISQRIASLYRLPELKHGVLVVPINTALHRLAPTRFLLGRSLVLDVGQRLEVEEMRGRLEAAGYRCVETVYEHGEFAVRGCVARPVPDGQRGALPHRPVRRRNRDPAHLRSGNPAFDRQGRSIRLLPAREFPLDKKAIGDFRGRFRERFDVDFRRCPIYQDLATGITPAGIEYYLPLFFEETCDAVRLPARATPRCFPCPVSSRPPSSSGTTCATATRIGASIRNGRCSPPLELFLPVEDCFARLKNWPRVITSQEDLQPGVGRERFAAAAAAGPGAAGQGRRAAGRAAPRSSKTYPGRVLFCAESAGRREVLLELLARLKLRPAEVGGWNEFVNGTARLAITIAPLDEGLLLDELALIPESPLFGQRIMQRRRRDKAPRRRRKRHQAPHRAARGRAGGAHRPWRRPLPGPGDAGRRRPDHRVPDAANTPTTPSSTCRCPACT